MPCQTVVEEAGSQPHSHVGLGFPLELQLASLWSFIPTVPGMGASLSGCSEVLLNESPGALHSSPQTEPFFRVVVKNEERIQEGTSCLSKVYVTLPQTTVTLLKDRRTLVSPAFAQLCWGRLWAAAVFSRPVPAACRPSQG